MSTSVASVEPTTATAESAPEPERKAVAGWVLYDLANTIFSLNIISLYLSLWVVDDDAVKAVTE